MSDNWIDGAEIECINISNPFEGDGGQGYFVGRGGITRIEAINKSGMHADIPYVRVWAAGDMVAEFCQHNIVGVYFKRPKP